MLAEGFKEELINGVSKKKVLWFGIWGARLESGTDFDFLDRINKWHHTVITFENKSKEAKTGGR